ncbi:MAG: hypothetical protein K6E74_03465 [Bacilli bacterium]|nr:hypothetical protein [Bacilli bacterium]
MKEIVLVTHNQGKVQSAQKYFHDTKLEIFEYELEEPRSDDLQEIVASKVKQAYDLVKKPCIAQDSGFFIEALNGFPKSFVNFTLETLGIEGILKLMNGIPNRKCCFKECLAYFDGVQLRYFDGNHDGTLSEEILGADKEEKWSDLWYIFKPYGYEVTLAEMDEETRNNREYNEHNKSSFRDFANWFEK